MQNLQLQQRDSLPEGLLELPATRLHEVLDGPTLIHLSGKQTPPLFVSLLLHGNEDTGWEAMRRLLKEVGERPLPRALSLFIGNVEAARHGWRRLDDGPDFNRIWGEGDEAGHQLARQVKAAMQEQGIFASLDIHNNTGLNPHYACINRLDHRFLHLALLFSRTIVYFVKPDSVQSLAFSHFCPSVTVECGKPGLISGIDHVYDFINAALHLRAHPEHPVAPHDYDLFHTVAVVKIPPPTEFSFSDPETELLFEPDLDQLNFRELPAGTPLARTTLERVPLEAVDEVGNAVTSRYFALDETQLVTRLPVMPSMLTLDERVIRQDCLCYLMERLPPLPT